MENIPQQEVLRLCSEILEENRQHWWRLDAMRCWGCLLYSCGDPDDPGCSAPPCDVVLRRYEQQLSAHDRLQHA